MHGCPHHLEISLTQNYDQAPLSLSLSPSVCLCSSLPLSQNHVRSPVLLLWGERDAFLEQEMAEACRLYIRNHFRLNIISGASHWLQQDQPDIVNTLIWTFLKEGEGRKSYRN
uniref:AB hydrolase-1 domain-containing protein n=1 Tax=Anabas testudineus TaxID=64144 RepID=A0A7N6AGC3_ANATE